MGETAAAWFNRATYPGIQQHHNSIGVVLSQYHKPARIVLFHLGGYGIPIELFAPFTDSCVVVMKRLIESMANAKDDQKKAPRQRSAALGFCHSGIQQGVSVRFYTFQQVFANAAASLLKLWYVASRSETFLSSTPLKSSKLKMCISFVKFLTFWNGFYSSTYKLKQDFS